MISPPRDTSNEKPGDLYVKYLREERLTGESRNKDIESD